jgi:hypothetical protein
MSVRTFVVTLAVAASFAAHAPADGVGVNTQSEGFVFSSSETLLPLGMVTVSAEQVSGVCSFTGQTTLTGQRQYHFGGQAVASSASQSQPELTVVKCTLISPAQGLPGERPTLVAEFEIGCPGPVCVTASTVTNWPVRPVVICISGYARFGPMPSVEKSIQPDCV